MASTNKPFDRAYSPATRPEMADDLTVGDVLRQAAREAPDLTALKEGLGPGQVVRRWTYAELLTEAERVARAMLEHVDPGDKVAIWAHNVPEWVVVQMGTALAGLTLVTVNPALRAREALHVLDNSGAAIVFHLDEYREFDMTACLQVLRPQLPALRQTIRLAEWDAFCRSGFGTTALPEVTPLDLAQIQYTSGTTGLPKGAALQHRGIVNSAKLSICQLLPNAAGASLVNPMPLFHTAGSVLMVLGSIQARAGLVLMPNFDPALQLALIECERSLMFGGVSTMLRAMLDHPTFGNTDLSSVRLAISGGAVVEPALAREVESKVGVPLAIVYGQTECSGAVSMTRPDDDPSDRETTVGRAVPGVEVQIVDLADRTSIVPVGDVGEICTRGYHVMAGYYDDPEQTDATIDNQGWLHTGDLASMDGRGYLRIEGRISDMIIRGGENIYPREIEDVLITHTAVTEAAVVGVSDDYWGEQVAAFVRLAEIKSIRSEELQSFLASYLAPHKIPSEWHFVEEFPLNATGKVLKKELREQAMRLPDGTGPIVAGFKDLNWLQRADPEAKG